MITIGASIVDHGPRYAETLPGRIPVEPWATYTNLVFLFTIVYWALRIRRSPVRHRMLIFALPILGIGWFGGTVYHATRSHNLWLAMDWMPIMILALTAAFWLWRGITGRSLFAALAMELSFLPTMLVHNLPGLKHGYHISLGYSMMALTILVPAGIHCALRWRAGWPRLACSVAAFAVAIAARVLDSLAGQNLLPMGSHFLWHIFGGLAAFCLISYIFGAGERAAKGLSPSASAAPNNSDETADQRG